MALPLHWLLLLLLRSLRVLTVCPPCTIIANHGAFRDDDCDRWRWWIVVFIHQPSSALFGTTAVAQPHHAKWGSDGKQ